MVSGVAAATTEGRLLTTTCTLAVFRQPFSSVPVTLYVDVVTGNTTMELPVPPVLHA